MQRDKILVTGAYGLVGSRVIELWDEWAEIIASNRDVAPFNLPFASFIPCDITDTESVMATVSIVKPRVILHLAAYTDVDGAEAQYGDKTGTAWMINVEGTRNIVEAAQRHKAFLYHASTDFVFGDDGSEPHDENSPRHPVNWYGVTKVEAEKIVEQYPDSCIMRFAYPYRAHFSLKKDFVHTLVEKMLQGSLPPLFTDQYITPTFIDDLAPALKTIIERKVTGTINLCGASWYTPFEIGQLLARALGLDGSIVKPGLLREYERQNPSYAHRPLNGRTMSRRTASLGITMRQFPDAIGMLIKQGLRSN